MKKIITFAALLVTMFTTTSFAADSTNDTKKGTEASMTIRNAFRKDFRNARIISAEARKNYTVVTFDMNDMVLFAFYSDNGDLMAVTRNILKTQLPIALQVNLNKNYEGYWVSECIEYNADGQMLYYISLENADHKVTLRSTDNNSWEVYQKTDKQ